MKITKRDLRMSIWMNRFGYATADQIARKFGISKQVVYRRLRNMEEDGHVVRERILFGEAGVYRPTAEILGLGEAELPPLRRVSLATYQHMLAVTDLCLALEDRYPSAKITTEREIRAAAGQSGVGQEGHFPDAILTQLEKRFAIEFEQSSKGKNRRQKIQNSFLRGNLPGIGSVDGVWYIVPSAHSALANSLAKRFVGDNFFQVFLFPGLEEVEAEVEPVRPETLAGSLANFRNFRR